jgi:metal-responsive CopG/Arc/MetJ family transcriptional regulator
MTPPLQISNPTRDLAIARALRQYIVPSEKTKPTGLEDAIISTVSKNIESSLAEKGASITGEVKAWIREMVHSALMRIIAEL